MCAGLPLGRQHQTRRGASGGTYWWGPLEGLTASSGHHH